MAAASRDQRFEYEPMLSAHPLEEGDMRRVFLDRLMQFPIFVSSMTGGTEKARIINHNLAKICGEYGLGMGLGSCRQLLYDQKRLEDFDVRDYMPEQALMVNLGIAQVEELLANGEISRIEELKQLLRADALIIHVNPLQEWLQPEGDKILRPPLETIKELLDKSDIPVIVKEVGQGFGKSSLQELLRLPIAALDLAGFGGTNFSKLELMRSDEVRLNSYKDLFRIGHTCEEMLEVINEFHSNHSAEIRCRQIIFSGGIKGFLDGYYFMKKCNLKSYYAQASAFLRYAQDYKLLKQHVELETQGLLLAQCFLSVKN